MALCDLFSNISPDDVAALLDGPSDLAALLLNRPAWHRYAACRGTGPELYFPERTDSPRVAIAAKAVCAGCIVQSECLDDAMADPLRSGVWGGTSARDRRRLRAGLLPVESRPEPVRRPSPVCGTESGANAHRKHGEAVCEPCKAAAGAARAARRSSADRAFVLPGP